MFKKNRYYSLQEIAGETYLLPYGQSLVERRHGFALGETGLYLWEKLDHCQNKTELIEYLTKEKGVRYDAAKDDVDNFIDFLFINQYGGNTDWDHHNWLAFRNRELGYRGFCFVCWDTCSNKL